MIKFVSDLIATCRWFSPGIPVSSTKKTERHNIAEILLKVALNIITIPNITTKVTSSNPSHGEVYSIQLNVIKFVSDLRQVDGILLLLWIPLQIKLTVKI